ncbi:MAG: S41 family peptidase [Kiloniellaceae bacterium]
MLVEAYEDVGEAYNADVAASEMALAGLDNLAAIEPGLAVHKSGDTVTLKLGAASVYSFAEPAGNSVDDWAKTVGEALVAVHQRSGPFQRTDPQRIYDSYMAGLASALGDDSRYFPSEEFYGYLYADVDGLIDLTYAQTEDGLRVLSLDREGRLAAAGVEIDDIITHIDGKATAGRSRFEVYSLLRGPVESKVFLNVLRDGTALPSSIVVQRRIIEPRSYELSRNAGVAVYSLPVLNELAANALAQSLSVETRRTDSQNRPLKGIVLDLRGEPEVAPNAVRNPSVTLGTSRPDWSNIVGYIDTGFMAGPGGSPDAARRLASAFMSDGVVFRQRGKQDKANIVVEAGGTNPSGQLPLVVIVDSSTTGGAEIAAAALQDSGRALVIGASTAGGGIIRRNVSLYNLGVINLPWAQAYAPSGYGIAGRGVLPDVCVSAPDMSFDSVMTALRRGEGLTDLTDRTRSIDPGDKAALAMQRALCPAEIDEGNLAIELALAILKDPGLYERLLRKQPLKLPAT